MLVPVVALISRIALIFTITLQLVVPVGTPFRQHEFSVAQFFCAPESSSTDTAARNAIIELLSAAGLDIPTEEPQSSDHCEKCLSPALDWGLNTDVSGSQEKIFFSSQTFRMRPETGLISVRGPPLGQRAPPAFV